MRTSLVKSLLFLLLGLITPRALASSDGLIELPPSPYGPVAVGASLYYFLDYSESLQLEDILQPDIQARFIRSVSEKPGFGKGNMTVWIRMTIAAQPGPPDPWVIDVAYPTFDTLQFFYPTGTHWATMTVGDQFPFAQRPYLHRTFVFPLLGLSHTPTTYYFRISSKGSLIFPATLYTPEQLHHAHTREELTYGLFYGIMLVMLFYNLFLAISSGSRSYLFYTIIILGNLLAISSLNGHAFQYIWPAYPRWANEAIIVGIGLWIMSSNLFARHFLGTNANQGAFRWLFRTMASFGLVLMVVAMTLDYSFGILLSNGLLLINCLALLASGVVFWIRGLQIARLYTIAWSVYLIGVILYTVRNLGLLPVNFLTSHVMEIGAVLEVVLLSIALGYKYKKMERDQKTAKEKEVQMMQENKALIERQNAELEDRIRDRTQELRQKQQEILAQNEELQQQREELTAKNEKMEEARLIIDKQHQQLRLHSEQLEKKVDERTRELIVSNKELAESVQKMEQYSYITAHNLRAPVARLLGLIKLTELQPMADLSEETKTILQKIKEEGMGLDGVIKDMNTILEIKNSADESLELINLEEKIQQTLHVLKHAIQQTEAVVEINFAEAPQLRTNPVYLDSIFYNLISNAIKYRSPERAPHIKIRSFSVGRQIVIEVSDNGLGMNLIHHKKNLFGMYKRFHHHVEGKGLGLYLVKSQMELAGGKIEVESEPEIGTTFRLTFKKSKA